MSEIPHNKNMKDSEDYYSQIEGFFRHWKWITGTVISALILPIFISTYLRIHGQTEPNIFSGPQNQIEQFRYIIMKIAIEHNLWYAIILSGLVIWTTFIIINMVYKIRLSFDQSVCK